MAIRRHNLVGFIRARFCCQPSVESRQFAVRLRTLDYEMRPVATAPHDRPLLLASGETGLANYWPAEMSARVFGGSPGDYRPGWFAISDSSTELDRWEPVLKHRSPRIGGFLRFGRSECR
jgi:hypothetical protein